MNAIVEGFFVVVNRTVTLPFWTRAAAERFIERRRGDYESLELFQREKGVRNRLELTVNGVR